MLLSLFHTTLPLIFFIKKFICSNVYISANTILECFYKYFLVYNRGHQLGTYTTGGVIGEGHPKSAELGKG